MQTPGEHPGTATYSPSNVGSLTGTLLISNNAEYIISNDGFYVDLGGGTPIGGGISTVTFQPATIPTA